jgi:hypothetical protein
MKKSLLVSVVVILIVMVLGILLLKRGRVRDEEDNGRQPLPVPGDVTAGNPLANGATGVPGAGPAAPVVETHQQRLNKMLAALNMSPSVRALLGLTVDKGDRDARRDALKKLSRTLTPDDVEAMTLFLDFRYEDNAELSSAAFDALKNDALVVLLNQKQLPDGLGVKLADMFKDENHSTRWRDYSLQYIAQYYEAVVSLESPEVASITNAYAAALDTRSEKFAGTALLAVERLSREHAEFDREAISDAALKIALSGDTCHDSRITALRVCAMMNRTEVLPQARILAQTGAIMPVRLAAIATVGDLGDESDLEYLESLAASDDRRLQRISKTASECLKKRIGEASGSATGV